MSWKWSDLAFVIALNGLAIALWRVDTARSVAVQERDSAIESVVEVKAKWRQICDELLDDKIDLQIRAADCPACKLRAEADTQAFPGSVPTLAEPGEEYLPDPRPEDECE